mmetsp:Transcript_1777/g.2732  ORF Transcript_1777/g.2732 Transcript_1777/m.2732 type:complete len:225 (+) Transcript_1777:564-1238(+)
MSIPTFWSKFFPLRPSRASFEALRRAVPPPGTIPSSTAARVAFSASVNRSFFSLTSTSELPPTLITATPPDSFASLSCSFSFSYSLLEASIAVLMLSQRSAISSAFPAPFRIIVSSLETVTFLACPRASAPMSSSFTSRSSLARVAPLMTEISCKLAFLLSPNPGALTATTLRPPRSLLITRVARASDSTSSATISKGDPCRDMDSRIGISCCADEIFFSTSRI